MSQIDIDARAFLQQGDVASFNCLRELNPEWIPDLREIDLRSVVLCGVNFYRADLRNALLTRASLRNANMEEANLVGASYTMLEPERTDSTRFF